MKVSRQIFLYGNSVILGSIVASLRHLKHFEVKTLALPLQETQMVDAAKANVILFDLGTTHPDDVLTFLKTNPTLQLIGIRPDINLVKIWSTRELRELSMLDLLNVINNELECLPAGPGDVQDSNF